MQFGWSLRAALKRLRFWMSTPVAVDSGRLLRRELTARKLSATRLAFELGVASGRIANILIGKRVGPADTALRLARGLGTSAQFWMDLPTRRDLTIAEENLAGAWPSKCALPRADFG
jgi:addiction module HigA family antidote